MYAWITVRHLWLFAVCPVLSLSWIFKNRHESSCRCLFYFHHTFFPPLFYLWPVKLFFLLLFLKQKKIFTNSTYASMLLNRCKDSMVSRLDEKISESKFTDSLKTIVINFQQIEGGWRAHAWEKSSLAGVFTFSFFRRFFISLILLHQLFLEI